jgi:hypothetical protein
MILGSGHFGRLDGGKLLLALASTVTLGSESRGIHDPILLFHDSGCRAVVVVWSLMFFLSYFCFPSVAYGGPYREHQKCQIYSISLTKYTVTTTVKAMRKYWGRVFGCDSNLFREIHGVLSKKEAILISICLEIS